MAVSDAQKRANAKYEREKTRSIKIKLTISTDADILAKLDAVGNKQGYIKKLIRDDLKKEGNKHEYEERDQENVKQ